MDCSPPGSSVHGISQARILEWLVISFSKGSPQPKNVTHSPTLQVDSLPLSHWGSPGEWQNRLGMSTQCIRSSPVSQQQRIHLQCRRRRRCGKIPWRRKWHSNILAWEIPWTVWPRVIVQRAAKSGQGWWAHTYFVSTVLLGSKEKWTTDPYKNKDDSQNHHTKWKKPNTRLHGSIYMKL